MTKKKRKWLHAAIVTMAAAATDTGAQDATGHVNPTRIVLVAGVMGIITRGVGASFSAAIADDESASS